MKKNNESINKEANPKTSVGKLFFGFMVGLLSSKERKEAIDRIGKGCSFEIHLDGMEQFIGKLYDEGYQVFTLKIDMTGDRALDKGIAQVEILHVLNCRDCAPVELNKA